MTTVIVNCAIILSLVFTVAMFVTGLMVGLKGRESSNTAVRLLIVFMWAYQISLAVLYSTRMLTGGYSPEEAIVYSILFPLGIVGFWLLSLRLYAQKRKRPILT